MCRLMKCPKSSGAGIQSAFPEDIIKWVAESRNWHPVAKCCTLVISTLVIRLAFFSPSIFFLSPPHCSFEYPAVSMLFLQTKASSRSWF